MWCLPSSVDYSQLLSFLTFVVLKKPQISVLFKMLVKDKPPTFQFVVDSCWPWPSLVFPTCDSTCESGLVYIVVSEMSSLVIGSSDTTKGSMCSLSVPVLTMDCNSTCQNGPSLEAMPHTVLFSGQHSMKFYFHLIPVSSLSGHSWRDTNDLNLMISPEHY